MSEIKCPHCGKMFKIDESGYMAIANQVRDFEFEKELAERLIHIEEKKADEAKIAALELEEKIKDLENDLKLAKAESKTLLSETEARKNVEISDLKARLERTESEKELAVTKAVSEKEKEIAAKSEELIALKENYDIQLKGKDEQISYYKDFKARQSTKLVGETLEQHCEIEFNKLRATAFKNAYFEKDNDASGGTKGDFIYREATEDGVEFISIMFEMKNESETTATKHKNEDFLKKLDKDRTAKNCEYAVLVSMLEADNELYNQGIVDVSYLYPKMYVIRPQLFIPMITLLRDAALNAAEYQTKLKVIEDKNVDISNFEKELEAFKGKFGNNVRLAQERFEKAIKEIDETIKHLEKVKDNLSVSKDKLLLADRQVDDITVKKLAKNSPSLKEELKASKKK